jgi:hypothetical protein
MEQGVCVDIRIGSDGRDAVAGAATRTSSMTTEGRVDLAQWYSRLWCGVTRRQAM